MRGMIKAMACCVGLLAGACSTGRDVDDPDRGAKSDDDRDRRVTLSPGDDLNLTLWCTNYKYECELSFNLTPVERSEGDVLDRIDAALKGKTAAQLPIPVFHQHYSNDSGLSDIVSGLEVAVTDPDKFAAWWSLADRTPVWFNSVSHNVTIPPGEYREVELTLDAAFGSGEVTFGIVYAEATDPEVP